MDVPHDPKLDEFLRARFHGADNIRGIRYQLLYSILAALDLCHPDEGVESVQLEGIEDIDLLGFNVGNRYVQVKTSKNPWPFHGLKDPLEKFLETYREAPDSEFELVIGARLRPAVEQLANYNSLRANDRSSVDGHFAKLCEKLGATSEETEALLQRLTVTHLPEEELVASLRRGIVSTFGLSSPIVDVYLQSLLGHFLDWARNRRVLRRNDLEDVHSRIQEAQARESEFQAYGKSLIGRISWDADASVEGFFDGKGARSGHIVAGVDMPRPKWLRKISVALTKAGVCVVRSSSGQGKSTLLYRYAHENWQHPATFELRLAETDEHVEMIRDYLRFRADVQLPTLILLDNAGARTCKWPEVARECAALDIPMLVSTRVEDWERYARPSVANYEMVEPELDLEEARGIFASLEDAGRIHDTVDSPERAFERVGEPHLLMEYVYFITHGRMLEDRLREQVRQFTKNDEDPAKVELLRRAATAAALGVHVRAEELTRGIDLKNDLQLVLSSMDGEYIDASETGQVAGLHWVRSNHLMNILHPYRDPAKTALEVFDAVPPEEVPTLVSNALQNAARDPELFLDGLHEKVRSSSLDVLLKVLDGLFEWGERQFVEANRSLFTEVSKLGGTAAAFILSCDFAPVSELNVIDRMVETLEDKAGGLVDLQSIARRVERSERGLHKVHDFLAKETVSTSSQKLVSESANAGRLLDWLASCDLELDCWPEARDALVGETGTFDVPVEDLCMFGQGLYRYDVDGYTQWFSTHESQLLGYLRLHLDCIELSVEEDCVSIRFFPESGESLGLNEQAMSRLKKLRSALPWCERYSSSAIWTGSFGLKPSVDDTVKNIPPENLPFESDVEKNRIWRTVARNFYLPDTYYAYQKAWSELREVALNFAKWLSRVLKDIHAGRNEKAVQRLRDSDLPERLEQHLKQRPDPPLLSSSRLEQDLREHAGGFARSLHNFLAQFFSYTRTADETDTGRLLRVNLRKAASEVPKLHEAFGRMFRRVPDYFDMTRLREAEQREYNKLAELVEGWVEAGPVRVRHNVLNAVRKRRMRRERRQIGRVEEAVRPLDEFGVGVTVADTFHRSDVLTYLPMTFSVIDPCFPVATLLLVLQSLIPVADVADFMWLVPTWDGKRFMEGYRMGRYRIEELAEGDSDFWEGFVPQQLPQDILDLLPDIPFQEVPGWRFRQSVLGLLLEVSGGKSQEQIISPLEKSESLYDRKLFAAHQRRLGEALAEIAEEAESVREQMDALFPETDTAELSSVRAFLDDLEQAAQQQSGFQSVLSDDDEVERVVRSLDSAMRITVRT